MNEDHYGLEEIKDRIIEPKRWAPTSAFRGIINILSDAVLERDREVLALRHFEAAIVQRMETSEPLVHAFEANEAHPATPTKPLRRRRSTAFTRRINGRLITRYPAAVRR